MVLPIRNPGADGGRAAVDEAWLEDILLEEVDKVNLEGRSMTCG